jgi:nucleotide-binding universal stress UspA family protein
MGTRTMDTRAMDSATMSDGVTDSADTGTIVVGVDGSQPSVAALHWAAVRAQRRTARLLLLHVADEEGPDEHRATTGSRTENGRDLLDSAQRLAAAAAPSATIETRLLTGDPVWSLIDGAADAREIAVGSHKTGFLRGASFGSRTLQLAAASPVPVVVVPPSDDPSRAGVVVGVDESSDGRAALAFAARHAAEEGHELILVRCESPRRDARRLRADDEAALTTHLADARRWVAAAYPGLRVRSRVVHGSPAQALVRASAHAALLVVGRSQGTDTSSPLGRVTHDVLLNLGVATAVIAADRDPHDRGTFDPDPAS